MEPSEQEEDDNFSSESEAEAEDAMNPPPAMQLPPEQVHNLYNNLFFQFLGITVLYCG